MTENSIVNLLLVDRIDAVTQLLRDGGLIVQADRLEQEAEIRSYLNSKPIDLVIMRSHDDLPAVGVVRDLLEDAGLSLPIIVLADDGDSAQGARNLLQAGADSLATSADSEQLLRVVRKELDYLALRDAAKDVERKLSEAESRSRVILDNAGEAIAYIHEGVHMYVNPAYVKLFGYATADELEGVTLMDMVASDDRNAVKRFLRDSTKEGKSLEPMELRGVRTDGSEMPIVMRCQPTRIDEEPCLQINIATGSANDPGSAATTLVETNHDPLTQLYSRGYFIDFLGKRLADPAKAKQGALLYILLEAYRPLNNRFGLAAGDALVSELASTVSGLFEEDDVTARFGDGIFTVFIANADRKTLVQQSEKICAAIKANTAYLDQSLLTTHASIGICMMEDAGESAITALSRADQACEEGRRAGGNRPTLHAPIGATEEVDERAVDEEAVGIIHEAITAERMRLLYQPIVSFAEDREERYQAMMQILDEKQQPVDMGHLLPIAERTNLMLPLDKWTIVTALSALTDRYQENQSPIILFVRISGNALHDKEFPGWLEKRLSDTGLSSAVLVVEVTESVAEKHFKEAKPFRERMQALGCGFALASFGGKANSERILNNLTPDYIKLDSELIETRTKSKDEKARESMTNLTQQAQSMNADVVASGIENATQMASIWQFGVTLVQGDMVREPDEQMAFDFAEFAG